MGIESIAIVSGSNAIMVASFLSDNDIPVVVPSVHNTPGRSDDDYDLAYKLPVELTQRGVSVSLSHSGMLGLSRNLPFYAGTTVAHSGWSRSTGSAWIRGRFAGRHKW